MGYKREMDTWRGSSGIVYQRGRRRRQRRRARLFRTTIIVSLSAATMILFGKEVLAHSWKNMDNTSEDGALAWQSLLPITEIREKDVKVVCDERGMREPVVPLESKGASEEYDFSKPVPASAAAENDYFDDAVFIGDSRT